MNKMKSIKAEIENHPIYKVPRRIYNIRSAKSSEIEPRKIAESMLKKIAKDLRIKPNLADLKFDKVRKNILGSLCSLSTIS